MKTKLGTQNSLYPMPAVLVGVKVKNKPNFITIAHVGIIDMTHISISINQEHYSCLGIRENKAFSINIPPASLVEKTDYCGLVSGDRTDKAKLFEVEESDNLKVPLIRECPLNIECRLVKTLNFPDHDIYIGEIVETYCDEEFVENGKAAVNKMDPLLFTMSDRSYYKLGGKIADAWKVGEKLI